MFNIIRVKHLVPIRCIRLVKLVNSFFYLTCFGVALGATISTTRKLLLQYQKWSISTCKTKECLPHAIILFSICILGNKIWKNISNYFLFIIFLLYIQRCQLTISNLHTRFHGFHPSSHGYQRAKGPRKISIEDEYLVCPMCTHNPAVLIKVTASVTSHTCLCQNHVYICRLHGLSRHLFGLLPAMSYID